MTAAWPNDLAARAERLRHAYADCRLCPRDCGADRLAGPAGFCGLGTAAPCYKALVSHGEEAAISPTLLLDLGGCSLRCPSCSEWDHVVAPWRPPAVPLAAGWLASRLARARAAGARSVSFVGGEPTMHLLAITTACAAVAADDQLPLVWNTNGLLAPTALELLTDWVACWVVDAKVADDEAARRYTGAGALPYRALLGDTLRRLAALPPHPSGLPRLIIRHLALPGAVEDQLPPLLSWLAELAPDAWLNVMTGYLPAGPAAAGAAPGALGRTLQPAERAKAIALARAGWGRRLWIDGRLGEDSGAERV